MATNDATQIERTSSDTKHIIEHAKHLLNNKLDWLSPSSSLLSTGSRDFGRSIESSLTEISKGEVRLLQLRKRATAVVMSVSHYEELIRMKEMYQALIDRAQEQEVAQAADAYEMLYKSIVSSESRCAADTLFSATESDLRKAYGPGATEVK